MSSRVLKRAEKELAQTKVIIRHLPPDYTEEKLKHVIDPFPANDYFAFVPGNPDLGRFGCSRAYINLKKVEDIMPLRDNYDGLPLESDKGVKYRMIIELAPYQIIPRGRVKPDHRCGTILEDIDYKTFLEKYERQVDPLPSVDVTYLHEVEKMKVESLQATPLTEYLRNKYMVPRGHRGQKNKVLYATGSKKKKGSSSKESVKGGGSKSGKSASRKEKDASKSGVEKKTKETSSDPPSSKVIVMDKTSKEGGINGVDKRGGSRKETTTGESRRSKHPDQPLYGHGGRSSGGGSGGGRRGKDKKDEVIVVNHGNEGGKKRGGRGTRDGGYPKYGRGGQDRYDNHYEFKEDDDNYQGPDYAGSKGSRNRNRDEYRYEGSSGGRYHGRGRNNDYQDGYGGKGGGYRSHNK